MPSILDPVPEKPKPVEPPVPLSMREFGDSKSTRKAIYDNVLKEAQRVQPVSNSRFTLELGGVDYADPDHFSVAEQKKAILEGRSLSRRLRGTWRLKDNASGQVVDEVKSTIAQVPHMTQRGTFVINGSEWTLGHQMRLLPGVFSREKENGELEAHINIMPGKGLSHRYFLEPETGLFKMQIAQASLPLYPVLRAMGASDRQLADIWGQDLVYANKQKDDPRAVEKLYTKLISKGDPKASMEVKRQAVVNALTSMQLDPEVTKRTLGQPYDRLNLDAALATTRKILAINQGKAEVDDRDNLAFQHFLGPEDLLAERMHRDKSIMNQLLWKATNRGSLERLQPNTFSKNIHAAIMDSGLGQPLEEINPGDTLDQQARVSRLGYGGIPSVDSIPDEARNVNPSQLGFIDLVKAPECYVADMEVMTKTGWKLWPEVCLDDELACQVEGRLEFHKTQALVSEDYKGPIYCVENNFISYGVTPNHRMWVKKAGDRLTWQVELAETTFNKSFRRFQTGGPIWIGSNPDTFSLPIPEIRSNNTTLVEPIAFEDWAEFMGWYLAEGNCTCAVETGYYRTDISQSEEANPDNCERIKSLLSRLPFAWHQDALKRRFHITGKQLAVYLQQFGFCQDKFVPEELLCASEVARHRLLEVLLLGDGRKNRHGRRATFCSSSKRLSEDVQRLLFSLGISSRITFEKDEREPQYLGCWAVHLHENQTRTVNRFNFYTGKLNHRTEQYSGKVYCAQVPGGLLYVRHHNSVGFWCGNSFKVGVDSRTSFAARKGSDGRIYTPYVDRLGNTVYKSPQDVADLTIAFPGEMEKGEPNVYALHKGKLELVPRAQVDLNVPHMEHAFSPLSNMIPLKSATKGQRVSMGSRFLAQALPLHEPEAPYVRSAMPGRPDRAFEDHFGKHMGAVFANERFGRVISVSPDEVVVGYEDGTKESHEIYNNFPNNRKSVTGDTVIWILREGQISRLPIKDYIWHKNDKTLTIDPDNKKSGWLPVAGYLKYKNDKRIFKIITDSGRSVNVTEDHSLMTMGSDGVLTPIFPLDCVINRTRLPIASLPTTEINDDRLHMSSELGNLIGLYLSGGHCPPSQPGLITIAVAPDARVEEVMYLLRRLGHSPYRNGGVVAFTDHDRCNYLVENFGHLSHCKKIPSWIFHTPANFRRALVIGYMGGDGCLWADTNSVIQVTAVSVSRELRDGMVAILSSLRIFTTLFDAPRQYINENWHNGYGFRVINPHLKKMPQWFFYIDRHLKFVELLGEKSGTSPFEMIPIPDKKARKLLYQEFDEVPRYIYKTAHLGAVPRRLLSGEGAFGKWGDSDVMWDKVVSIQPIESEEWVYDLSVAKAEAFAVGQGLVVHNTYIHSTPIVRPGDPVKPGQLLARSNYTDAEGSVALGKNLRVAFMPFRGRNYEDAFMISESAAKKLSSEHMYQHQFDWDEHVRRGKRNYVGIFPATYGKKILEKMDEDGVITPGMVVNHGDPLVLAAVQRELSHKQVHSAHKGTFADRSITWDHHSEGIVTDVAKTPSGVLVAVKSLSPTQVGDKIAGRYGNKGVISQIIPDDQMPHDEQNRPYEVLANPLGVISRTNPSQVIEAVLGKIAEKTGKAIKVPDFSNIDDATEWAIQEAEKHGIKDLETVVDPVTGRRIPEVLTGNQFIMKLQHTAEGKDQGRGLGAYTAEEMPAKGGTAGSKRLAMMDVNAALSHGATEFLRDAKLIRGQKNQEFWTDMMAGFRPPTPDPPITYSKFLDQLRASGINVERSGSRLHILDMTDKDIEHMAGDRELKNAETVDWKTGMKPIEGGLFDTGLTGGHNGNRWSYIKLHEVMPNPVQEEPIRKLLGLTEKEFLDVIGGTKDLGGHRGPQAIGIALRKINVPLAIEQARADIQSGRKTARDTAIKRLKYLKGTQDKGHSPEDWMLSRVPVLPPRWRPVSIMQGNGNQLISDANYLYKEVFDANDNLKSLTGKVGDVSEERKTLYNAFKAVVGLGDPVQPKNRERKVQGMLAQIFGSSPKYGTVQQKLLGTTVDLVGRAVVVPNPDMNMDEIGLPENRAWEVYTPFLVRRLVRKGVPRLQALEYVKGKNELARKALLDEMHERPVVVNRAPVLHRYGLMAFRPKLVKGDVLHVSPTVVGGFGMDFDGDASNYHVPASDEARDEAVAKMLPSNNLFAVSNFKVHYLTRQEYTGGLFEATRHKHSDKRPRIFAGIQHALAAYHEMDPDQPITILDEKA